MKPFPLAVLLVEDKEDTRIATAMALKARNFTVTAPGSAEAVRASMRDKGASLAVAIFDMWLNEPVPWGVTGAQLAMELRERYGARDTEILGWSAYQNFDYVSGSIRARAAAYLSKSGDNLGDLIRHVRVLGARWMVGRLSRDPRTARTLVSAARTRQSLLRSYAEQVLTPALDACLGTPFAVVEVLQNTIGGVWGTLELGASVSGEMAERLLQASPGVMSWNQDSRVRAATPLVHYGDSRLVLLLQQVQRDKGKNIIAESVEPLANLLGAFLPETLRDGLEAASADFQRIKPVRAAATIVDMALSGVQHARQALRDQAPDKPAEDLPDIEALAAGLERSAELLHEIAWDFDERGEDHHEEARAQPTIGARALIKDVLDRLAPPTNGINPHIEGDATLLNQGGDLAWSISTLVQWCVDRARKSAEQRSYLRFTCKESDDRAEIVIEDESERAPDRVRSMLFDIGAASVTPVRRAGETHRDAERLRARSDDLALFVAQAAIELRHQGEVRDDTKHYPQPRGHRFVLSFPRVTP